jgi:hypothetical protein
VRATGIKAIKIDDGDALIDVQITNGRTTWCSPPSTA